jgi:hypothetical protein
MMNSDNSGFTQSSSISTLVGYITGPKAEQPVGVRVVEPPSGTRQKQRGKMYAVVDLDGDHPDNEAISDHLLTVIQRTYYTDKGSQSNVMIEALRRAHQVIQEINERYPNSALRAGVLCAALLNDRLVIVASGSAMALVRTNDQVQMFPSELSSGHEADGDVPMQVFRQKLAPDDALFFGSSTWSSIVPLKTLAGIVAYVSEDNCAEAADELYAQGGEGSPPGLFVVLVDDSEAPYAATVPPTQTAVNPGGNGASRFFGLPTAVSVAPHRQSGSQSSVSQALRSEPGTPKTHEPQSSSVQAITDNSSTGFTEFDAPGDTVSSSTAETEAFLVDPLYSDDTADTEPDTPLGLAADDLSRDAKTSSDRQDEGWSTRVSVAAIAGFTQTRRFLRRMLPDGGKSEDVDSAPASFDTGDELHVSDSSALTAAVPALPNGMRIDDIPPDDTGDGGNGARITPPPPLPDLEPFTPPAPASGTRARVLILIALIIIILVPAVVAGVYWGEGENRRQQAISLTEAAQAQYDSALTSFDAGDKAGTREALLEGKDYLTKAVTLEGSTPERIRLASEIEQLLQDVLQVQPLYNIVSPLITFPTDSNPQRVLVADSSIYVLDSGQQTILRYRYDPTAGEVVDDEPQVVVRQGDVFDGATVGTLADMAWLKLNPSFADRPTLLILDRNNNLFSYDPRVEGTRILKLGGEEMWGSASQVQTYNGFIYIADEGANAIYKYMPGQVYEEPENWFPDDILVNLAGALSMEIDGDIWLLLGNGNIMRYESGEQLPFSLENSVGLAEEPIDMYVTQNERENIYLVDAGDDRILVYDKNGVYLEQLRAAEGDPLRGLSGLYIDEVDETMFILTKSALYSHPLL